MERRIEYGKTEDGVSIACAILGRGPAIVLSANMFGDLHGLENGALIDQLVAGGRQVAFYDGRGIGFSDRGVPDVSLETRVSDLESVVDRLGLETFALMGRMHGGAPAVAYAIRHPDKVTHLVLADAYVRGADYYSATAYTRAMKTLAGIAEADWEFFTLTIAHWVVGFRDAEGAKALAEAFKTGMSPQLYLKWLEVHETVDVSALLPRVSVATLVIHDRMNVLSDPAAGRSYASIIPGAQFVSVHGLEEVGRSVLEFTPDSSETLVGTGAGSPGAFRTVLFTDLVDHSQMMQRLGDDKGRDVLREHERITRETLAQYAGAEIKTMGDGFMASFGSVTAAMDCAIALQRAFASHNANVGATGGRPDGNAPLYVRVGLNAGEPIEEDGDLFGSTVILASRIAAQAGAGEILVPEPLRHLLSGKSYVYADRGEVALKGFDDAVRLYEVRWRADD